MRERETNFDEKMSGQTQTRTENHYNISDNILHSIVNINSQCSIKYLHYFEMIFLVIYVNDNGTHLIRLSP